MEKYYNNYPTVFIHGLTSWGSNDMFEKFFHYWGWSIKSARDMLKYLRKHGYEVYNPSTGPISSAWDRSCELYAQLMGGTVDYGKVHSEKYGHARYGRTYEKALIPDWGSSKEHKKINLIGHSFGGRTVICFADLIANGCKEEIDATPANELSGLFKGGNDMIHTVTTLAGVNNGTTTASAFGEKGMRAICKAMLMLNTVIGETRYSKVFNLMTTHWGIQKDWTDIEKGDQKLVSPFKYMDVVRRFANNHEDNIAFEMTIETVTEINKGLKICPNTYYFARTSIKSRENKRGAHILDRKNTQVFCYLASYITGKYNNEVLRDKYGVDDAWLPNDGFMNLVAQRGPFNLPSDEWHGIKNAKPGIWYNFLPEYRDHFSWSGGHTPKKQLFEDYTIMLNMFRSLPGS